MKKYISSSLIAVVLVLSLLGAQMLPVQASPGLATSDLSTGLTPTDLANALLGGGISISNVTFNGVNHSAGTFSGGTGIIGFESGIILSSGNIKDVVGPNKDDATTTINGLPGDADLNTLIPGYTTFDATVLEFDFVPNASPISFQYVFGSEEYNEYVNTSFNNVFGFFVNGVNKALIPGTSTPVSINNVNGGGPVYGTNPHNTAYYRNNDLNDGGGSIDTELDGLTVVLTVTANVNTGVTNHIKLAIADAGDSILDSDVFIKGGSFIAQQLCPDKYDWSKTTAHKDGYQWSANKKTFTAWNIVRFVNKGTGDAKNVTATIVCWPLNVTPIDKTVFLGNIPAGGSAWSNFPGSPDPDFCLATDMTNPQDPKKGIIWKVEYDDAAGVHFVIQNVPKFCGEPINCP